jgi:hypothetical protein
MYIFRTKVGVFSIVFNGARWHIMFQDESLGAYPSAQEAASDLAGGHTFTPPGGFDTSELGVSEDISEWDRVK